MLTEVKKKENEFLSLEYIIYIIYYKSVENDEMSHKNLRYGKRTKTLFTFSLETANTAYEICTKWKLLKFKNKSLNNCNVSLVLLDYIL